MMNLEKIVMVVNLLVELMNKETAMIHLIWQDMNVNNIINFKSV